MGDLKDLKRRSGGAAQDRGGVMRLVRRMGMHCDFCGRLALAVAVEARPDGRQVSICSRCVGEAARTVHSHGGGDAA
ncbi:MAG: hypothetical protein ACYCX9_00830 [Candidatus Dormibacteria bacterium]